MDIFLLNYFKQTIHFRLYRVQNEDIDDIRTYHVTTTKQQSS